MSNSTSDLLGARSTIDTPNGPAHYYRIDRLIESGFDGISRFPFSIKVLLESLIRNCDGRLITEEDVKRLASYDPADPAAEEIPFKPARVLLQDFTGVPAVVDLAALRSAMHRLGGDPDEINPRVPVNLVIDHSVQVDTFGSDAAFLINSEFEFKRNRERYEFLRWGQQAFDNFHVVPPARGIVHQVNLEYIAKGVWSSQGPDGLEVLYPDSLVGTDSHTTMINGLGVVAWGVGGIEAEAVMLGQPIYMLMPKVVGFQLTGTLREGVTATDLTLTVVQMLRKKGVVGKFVEFFGEGMTQMTIEDRSMIANMAPEYGATMGFFPIDDQALDYLRRTGRSEGLVQTVEAYAKAQGMFRTTETPQPIFSDTLTLDLDSVVPSMAGPKRPQDRVVLPDVQELFNESITAPAGPHGFGLDYSAIDAKGRYETEDESLDMHHGDVAIAAITSCTNTSNPSVMVGAGLVAKKAVERGLTVKPFVKTSLAPGSRVVTEYLREAGLLPYLDQLGFNLVGYGCTTCIGNSGPLDEPVTAAIKDGDLIVAGVLSGNRNFEGRIHANVKANFLASPPLVVAYALAGTIDTDLANDPIGKDEFGKDVYLRDLWPSSQEIVDTIRQVITPELFQSQYDGIELSNDEWNAIRIPEGSIYEWSTDSTYIQEPPFFQGLTREVPETGSISAARVLVKVGNSTTTDHISPAGSIPADGPAGKYLLDRGVPVHEFNSFGSRRGGHDVMMRGTFANIRLRNQIAPGTEGGWTTHFPTGEVEPIYDAAMKYIAAGTDLIVLAGQEYGTGSSRDWAAKGTQLLGVKAVLAESYERIHRSNLVGMGVLPLQFKDGETPSSLGIDGTETFDIPLSDDISPREEVKVTATKGDGTVIGFTMLSRIDTPVEVEYYQHGGILNFVLREFLNTSEVTA
jgi:aconitate hydratase